MARIAVTVTSDFEDSELTYPAEALEAAGHEVVIIGEKAGEEIHGKRGKSKTAVAGTPEQRDPTDFDALLIPGGYSPDKLRTDPHMVSFVQEFFRSNKPVAAVCHGPQLLIEAGVVDGRTMTSWPSVKTDLKNAGATETIGMCEITMTGVAGSVFFRSSASQANCSSSSTATYPPCGRGWMLSSTMKCQPALSKLR